MRLGIRLPGLAIVLAALISLTGTVSPQPIEKPQPSALRAVPEIRQPLPFGVGEMTKYEIKFSRFPIYASVGEMTFTVGEEEPADPAAAATQQIEKPQAPAEGAEGAKPAESERLLIRGEAVSKGILLSLFGIKVKDIFETVLDKQDLGVYSARKILAEGKRRREQVATFEREKQEVTFVDKDLNALKEPPKVIKGKTGPWAVDPIAAVYFIRTQTLEEGKSIKVPITDNGKTNEVEIVVGKGEEISVEAGKFKTIRLDARVFNGVLFNGEGFMHIWVTDDANHVPVKFQIKGRFGTVTGNLIGQSAATAAPKKVTDTEPRPTAKTPEKSSPN